MALTVSGIQLYPARDFDQIVEIRAARHEHLRGRNNVTSCRSPTREIDTRMIKNELKKKRHLEFLRRRSVSPEPRGLRCTNHSSATKQRFSVKQRSSVRKSETLHTNIQNASTTNGHPVMILKANNITEGPSTSTWASLWSEEVTLTRQEKGRERTQASTSTTTIKESNQHRTKTQKTSIKTFIQAEKSHQKHTVQTENILKTNTMRETSVQTESGLVTVKESDVQRLADYLQEALWREEAMKKKLAALQESTSNLINSSHKIWTARCSEDLLRNKIKTLEAQLQVCLQRFPKDGMKKVVLQMEKQKMIYEEKALAALQKATQDKTEAICKAETMQEALIAAKTEALRWQSLYEELNLSSGQLMENQLHSAEQLQQLHSQVELSRAREAELTEKVVSLNQDKGELQYNICLLEEDNQMLREEIHHLRDGSHESQDFVMLGRLVSEEEEPQVTVRRNSQVEEQLRHTQEKLRLKEKECEELQSELYAMEQECQSSQARLSQCRDELRQISTRHKRPTLCGSWWKVWMFFLLILIVAEVAMLWLWYPPFREQVEDLYSDIETRIDNYLMEMASPRHSGCFRPI
uniref:TRAF3-interacting JNK-activating modulator n=1 Tax=Scatophagus argus TaxID=75038 RepID=UPI001ED84C78|nr:TRAF3-interacting JNK-activating modulator [Scatophagus argus]XP_046253200.1 TRAF3-interacting JNK-activating modulator [Scatophagus argus]